MDFYQKGVIMDLPDTENLASFHKNNTKFVRRWRSKLVQRGAGLYPSLYFQLRRFPGAKGTGPLVRRNTELVIEGFPRSSNSFAEAAFQLVQKKPVRVASHTHVPAQVIQAVKWSIPTIVLFREPDDVVVSLIIFQLRKSRGNYTIYDAYKWYISYHRSILPYRRGFVLASFRSVTTDFGAVIRKVNDRFGTSFAEFENTPEMVGKAYEHLDEISLSRGNNPAPYSPHRGQEIKQREAEKKQKIRRLIQASEVEHYREEAREIFDRLTKISDC